MPIDKSWMKKPRVSSEYDKGVLELLDFVFGNAPGKSMLPCPLIGTKRVYENKNA